MTPPSGVWNMIVSTLAELWSFWLTILILAVLYFPSEFCFWTLSVITTFHIIYWHILMLSPSLHSKGPLPGVLVLLFFFLYLTIACRPSLQILLHVTMNDDSTHLLPPKYNCSRNENSSCSKLDNEFYKL